MTTNTSIKQTLVDAIARGVSVKITLTDGESREIEPRVVGTTTKGNLAVGGVKHDGLVYRTYKLENVAHADIVDQPSDLGNNYQVVAENWQSIDAQR